MVFVAVPLLVVLALVLVTVTVRASFATVIGLLDLLTGERRRQDVTQSPHRARSRSSRWQDTR